MKTTTYIIILIIILATSIASYRIGTIVAINALSIEYKDLVNRMMAHEDTALDLEKEICIQLALREDSALFRVRVENSPIYRNMRRTISEMHENVKNSLHSN